MQTTEILNDMWTTYKEDFVPELSLLGNLVVGLSFIVILLMICPILYLFEFMFIKREEK